MPLRKERKRESLSVSRKSLKQGKLELLFGLCLLEIGNLLPNGTLKQGRSKHSNDSLKQGRFKLPFPFYDFHFFINVLDVFFVFFKGFYFEYLLSGLML